ncbi:hypothetical protein [Salipaludibacillus sp. CF4.18]|uniref:hypothetical protein n=1 Tax=Salipaludibacillus sp. CF4.18 TaxID=3373081 RepID=UPI003EE51574
MLNIQESHCESKTGTLDNVEDTFLVTPDFAAVIDGASNVSNQLIAGKTPGQHAAVLTKEAIVELNGPESIEEIITAINAKFQIFYHEHSMVEEVLKKPFIRPSAVMSLYSHHHRKIWMIGDCQCYVDGVNHQHLKEVDLITSQARAMLIESQLAQGKTVQEIMDNDTSFDQIVPLLQRQYQFQNRPPNERFSYEVINGFPMYTESIKAVDVPAHVTSFSMGSDGYPRLFDSLSETEQYLEKILTIDPLCIKENSAIRGLSKERISYDDRTYIKVTIKDAMEDTFPGEFNREINEGETILEQTSRKR